jgi:tripartite-type tricarboxylate transporter receptor subunit TctC
VSAQAYPARTIRLIVPQTPGLLLDNLSRIMSNEMSRDLGVSIVVENRPGADGAVAYEHVAKSAADGYTLVGSAISNLAVLPLTAKDLRFDPLKDLPPFIAYADGRLMLGSSSTVPWKTYGEMVAHAKANPGKLNYGSVNANLRLVMESLIRESGINVVYIPYAGGAAFLQALFASDIHLGFVGESGAESYGDKFRALAVTGSTRLAARRDVPTFAELGFPQVPGLRATLNGPAGMPKAVVDKLYDTASRALQQPAIRAQINKLYMEVINQPPDQAAKSLADEARMFGGVAKAIGMQPQ